MGNDLYTCNMQQDPPTYVNNCPNGCTPKPPGTPDSCNVAQSCSGYDCYSCTYGNTNCVWHYATSTNPGQCKTTDSGCEYTMNPNTPTTYGGGGGSTPVFCAHSNAECSGSSASKSAGNGALCGASTNTATTCKQGCSCQYNSMYRVNMCMGTCAPY